MLAGYRNRFTSGSKVLNIERLGEQRPLPTEDEKAGRNKKSVRVDRGNLPGFLGVQRPDIDCFLFGVVASSQGAIKKMSSIGQELRFDLGSLLAGVIKFENRPDFSAVSGDSVQRMGSYSIRC